MRFLVDAIITNKTTGKTTPKAWTMEAVSLDAAYNAACCLVGGNETMIIKNISTVSDFSHR